MPLSFSGCSPLNAGLRWLAGLDRTSLDTFDLADNALPILLSHPISRFGYLLGNFIALFSSLSLVTWIPCLLLFAYQGYTSPQPWAADNLRVAIGLLAGSVLWIALLSIFGLALASWVKWRMMATGSIFAAVLCSGRRWRRGQRNSAHKMGLVAQPADHDVGTLAAAAGRAGVTSHSQRASQCSHRDNAGFTLLGLRGYAQCAHPRPRGGPG